MPQPTKPPRLDVSRYRGEWVALHPKTNRVISHHSSFKTAKQAAHKRGVDRPVLYAVPKSDAYFVG